MALIQCKNCGNEISDKALVCPNCGEKLIEEVKEVVLCEECGTEIPEDAESCPKCGCPIAKKTNDSQKVEITGVKIQNSPKTKKYVITAVIAVIVIALIAFLGSSISKNNAEKEAERIRQEYAETLEEAVYTMLSGAAGAEEAGNLIKQVWYNAIHEENDSRTDKYTTENGWGYTFVDFNTALSNLMYDSEFMVKLANIENNQATVKTLMKQLTNPPEEYEEAYDALKDFYDAYLQLTNLALDPTGSYNTYSESFNEADTEALKCYEAMGIYVE
ncbi:MAG: zinc-ribbon domain-containing protein [Oscillospiraceae bacterium]|nr:zinc-ribbon domain-containing protein [Oscillospiraceae bacterium]